MAKRSSEGLPLVTRAQLAKVLGVSVRTVANLEADEVLEPKRRGRGGRASLYDLKVAVPDYIAHVEHGKPGAADKEARTRKDLATARLTELRYQREAGEMVPRDEAVFQGQQFSKAVAVGVRSIPRRLTHAGVIGREQEPAAAAVCRDLLKGMATWKGVEDTDRAIAEAESLGATE
jgi:phage terminase Nu1 subunit (DNA packaging protein)